MDEDAPRAKRYLVMYRLWFHRYRGPKDEIVPIEESGLEKKFPAFCEEHKGKVMRIGASERYASIGDHSLAGPGTLVHVRSGSSGENVDVVNTGTMSTDYTYGPDRAGMVLSRCFLMCHPGSSYAHLCVEHVTNGAGDTTLLGPLSKFMREHSSGLTMEHEATIEPKTIQHIKSFDSIEVKHYEVADDISDAQSGRGSYKTLAYKRGRSSSLSMELLRRLVSSPNEWGNVVSRLFGVEMGTDEQGYETYMTVTDDSGAQKKFPIGSQEFDMKFKETLNEFGQPVLSDGEFIEKCVARSREAAERLGRMV
ncbi:hypothetical protein [Olsenella uli]|uniref:hypothetical protein n=1 Tax=Olsenella uli TaxID=133926 RepID=UPI0004510328|nr:hypothetical protein [Olsenella uli]EUB32712.1 hypothetical protein HMPREF1503_1151 [Olsenella uli MSTE5]